MIIRGVMRRFIFIVLMLVWALWFGGTIALFVFVVNLFARGVGPQAAPVLFVTFGRYQLVLAAISVVAAFGWWMVGRTRWRIALFAILAGAAVLAAAVTAVIMPRMEQLRADGQTKSAEFDSLHRRSETLYTAQALLLLTSGVMIALEATRARETASTTGPATAPPGESRG
jgi:hypothetical protein